MNPLLQEARAAAEAGDKAEAHRQIARVLQANPRDAEAWFLLSSLVDSPQQQATFLQKTLALSPDHAEAQQQLARLTAPPPSPEPPTPEPTPAATPDDVGEPWVSEEPTTPPAGDLDWLTAEPTGADWPAAAPSVATWPAEEPTQAPAWPAAETDDLSWLTAEPTATAWPAAEPAQTPAWPEAEGSDLSWLTGESAETTWTTAEQPAEVAWPEADTPTWPPPQTTDSTAGATDAFAEAAASDELPDWLAQAEPELAREMPELSMLEEEESVRLAGELDEEPLPDWLRQEVAGAPDWLEEPAAPVVTPQVAPAGAAAVVRPRRQVDRINVLLVTLITLAVVVLLALWYFIFVTFF